MEQMEFLLDHYKNPRNYGELSSPDLSYEDGNPYCGDEIRIDFNIEDHKVKNVCFKGKGCVLSQAAASILTDIIKDKSFEEIKSITAHDMIDKMGMTVSPIRIKCVLLALKVVKSALFSEKDWPDEND